MKNTPSLAFVLAAAALCGTAFHESAAETTISCDALPAAVKAKSQQETKGATVHGCSKDKENGQVLYEVSLIQDAKTRDLTFDTAGNLLEVEQEIAMTDAPSPVAAAIQKAAASSQVVKIESLSKQGAIVSYEASLRKGGKVHELAFSPDGNSMKPE